MKIGIVSFTSGSLGDALRVQKFCEVLGSKGFQVKVFNPISGPMILDGNTHGFRLSTYLPLVWNLLSETPVIGSYEYQRFLYEASSKVLSKMLLRTLKNERLDVLQAETHMAAEIALPLKEKLGIPMFFDIHSGSFIDEAEKLLHSSSKFFSFMRQREKEMLESSDEIFVVSNQMKSCLESTYGIGNISVVPNGADPYLGLRKSYANPLDVVYAGIFSYWERIEDYLDAAKLIAGNGFNFYLAGHGCDKRRLLRKIDQEKLPVRYLGYLPRELLRERLKKMHIGVVPMAKEESRRFCFSVKTFEYLSMGLPVVCADVGEWEWAQAVRDHDCGVVVPPEDPEAIADAICLYKDEELWRRHSQNGIRLVENEYSWEKIIGRIKPVYDKYAG